MIKSIFNSVIPRVVRPYIVSTVRKNKFWFIDIPRTSSSSIKIELRNRFGRVYGKSNLLEKGYGGNSFLKDHLTALSMRNIIGEELWEELFTFTIVRNPWDRMASMYFYRKKKGNIPEGLSFRDYIKQFDQPRYLNSHSLHIRPTYYYGATEYVLDKNDRRIVDFIGKFENREADLKIIAERIKWPDLGKLFLQKAKPAQRHYSNYYDDETRDIIGRVFKRDREMFGYEFEDNRN